jgi:hypothetical protein
LQSTKDATKFYEGKVEELGNNLKALEKILQEKNDGLRMIEDGKCHCSPDLECGFNLFFVAVLRQKVINANASSTS